MEIHEGSPEQIFEWFFGTDQGTYTRSDLMIFLYGTSDAITNLVEQCVKRQIKFDDALGPSILLLFFNCNISSNEMNKSGQQQQSLFEKKNNAIFAFSGQGHAHPIPSNLTEIGEPKFRTMEPNNADFAHLSKEIARSNSRSTAFFQTLFRLQAQEDYLILAHRKNAAVQIFKFPNNRVFTVREFFLLIKTLRILVENSKYQVDLDNIQNIVTARTLRISFISSIQDFLDTVRRTRRLF